MRERYYYLLGISTDATGRQIEEAYVARMRELSTGDADETELLAVQAAYSALGARKEPAGRGKRRVPVVDVTPRLLPRKPRLETAETESAEADIEVSLTDSFQTFRPSYDEIYDRLWSNFTGKSRPKSETPQGLTIDIPITSRQAYEGGTARVLVPTRIECSLCRGSGGVGPFVCLRCDGRGVRDTEVPLLVPFPAQVADHATQVSLDPLGIENLYLNVRFRVTREEIE